MNYLLQNLDIPGLVTRLVAFAPNIVVALLILLTFWVAYRLGRRPLSAAMRHSGMHQKLVELLVDNIFRYSMLAFGLVMALSQLGINVGAAVAGLGVVGIAVGLAAQDSLSNTIAGFTIFWDKPFVVGDWITVHGQYGMVQDITLRSTRIRTPRNSYVVIPNRRIIDEVLENDSKNGEVRIDVPIGIAYKEDIAQARQVLLAAAGGVPAIKPSPAADVVVENCGDSSVDLVVRVWVDEASSRQGVHFSLLESCKVALDEAGIQIPYPHLQVFYDGVEDRVVEKWRSGQAEG